MRNIQSVQRGVKEKILELRQLGYTYNAINKRLGVSKGTISYHCGPGQKLKTKKRMAVHKNKMIPLKREYIKKIKSSNPCVHCGLYDDPIVFDFHHVKRETKSYTISEMIGSNMSLNRLKIELDKCIMLCSNCHSKEEAKVGCYS